MKLGLHPLAMVLSILSAMATFAVRSEPAEAAPRVISQEDALADDEIDAEDIAVTGPFTSPSGALRSGAARSPMFRSSAGSSFVSIAGFSRQTIDDRREVGGIVVVGLPLDRFARGDRRATNAAPSSMHAFSTSLSTGDVEARRISARTDHPFDLALSPRLARSCVAAAWRSAGLGVDDARLDAVVSRARLSAALPEARFRAVRFEDARLSLDTAADSSKLRDSSGANVGFEARLTWRLDRLLYADDETSFERIRLEQRDARARIGARVLEALFHWQRAALDLRSLPPSQHGTRDEADVTLRVMEAEAALDVLTNGWFAAWASREASYTKPIPVGRGSGSDL